MTNMDDRQKAFENKYAHDQELMFKIEARASKLFGLWLAGEIGLGEEAANELAVSLIGANLEAPGFEDVLSAGRAAIQGTPAEGLSDHILETKFMDLLEEARAQVAGNA